MPTPSPDVLQLEGLNELEIAELRKAFRTQGVDLDDVASIEYPALDGGKLGEPGTAILLFSLAKTALPLVAGVLAGWVAKSRSGKKSGATFFTWTKDGVTVLRWNRSEFKEDATPETIQKKFLEQLAQPGADNG